MINWKNAPSNLSCLKSKVDKLEADKLVLCSSWFE